MPYSPRTARRIARALLTQEERARLDEVRVRDAGHGYDRFGLHADHVASAFAMMKPVYRRYFRVESHGAEHIPTEGPAILAANHSGTIPLDAMMIWMDVVWHVRRVPRMVLDHFVPALPFVSTLYARCGAVGGSRGNAHALLESGELLGVFPEGVPGIGKPYDKRYQLQGWRRGHVELAIRHRAPVIPIGVVGAEEQLPQLAQLPRIGRLLGLPYLPIVATPVPLPVHYHLHYGEPIALHERFAPEDADDPAALRTASDTVQAAVAALLREGLAARPGVFR